MSQYYDIVGFKKTQSGKTIGIRLGSAKKHEKDDGFYLNFDALPYGEMSVSVCPQREKPARQAQAEDDGEIPF
jgi:hypothetical protein